MTAEINEILSLIRDVPDRFRHQKIVENLTKIGIEHAQLQADYAKLAERAGEDAVIRSLYLPRETEKT